MNAKSLLKASYFCRRFHRDLSLPRLLMGRRCRRLRHAVGVGAHASTGHFRIAHSSIALCGYFDLRVEKHYTLPT